MFKYLFQIKKLEHQIDLMEQEIEQQEQKIEQQREIIEAQNKFKDFLMKEIFKRDQMISDQQRRMRFFGIEIGNEEYHPDPVDFPSTIKL